MLFPEIINYTKTNITIYKKSPILYSAGFHFAFLKKKIYNLPPCSIQKERLK